MLTQKKGPRKNRDPLNLLVGVRGFEPPATWPPAKCATRLRYTPICTMVCTMGFSCCQQRGKDRELLRPLISCSLVFIPSPYPCHATGRSSREARILSVPDNQPHSGAKWVAPAQSDHWQETFWPRQGYIPAHEEGS